MPSLCPYHLWLARERTLSFTGCSPWESGPYTGLGSRAELILLIGEQVSMGDLGSFPHLPYGSMGRGEVPSSLSISLHPRQVGE